MSVLLVGAGRMGSALLKGWLAKGVKSITVVEPKPSAQLRALAEAKGVASRVDFLGFVSDDDLLTLLATTRAAVYTPVNEDYGYVTLEAFLSGKTLITTNDTGGVLEFATAESGFIAEPVAESLGAAMSRAWNTKATRLREMAEVGHKRVAPIQWDAVIDTLTESIR